MTPAIQLAKKSKTDHQIHEYEHDPAHESYGTEAAEKLSLPEARAFKTLVAQLNTGKLAVGIVPVSGKLNLKNLAKAAGAKKAEMADPAEVERATGYVLGGVSPLGQKKRLVTVIDVSAQNFPTIFVSAGRRGLEIELAPADLQQLTGAQFAEISQ